MSDPPLTEVMVIVHMNIYIINFPFFASLNEGLLVGDRETLETFCFLPPEPEGVGLDICARLPFCRLRVRNANKMVMIEASHAYDSLRLHSLSHVSSAYNE
jgi:hypothetical protein